MNWIESLIADAARKSAVAASKRTSTALIKHASTLEALPKEWTIHDLMRLKGCSYEKAKGMVQTMIQNGLIFPARDIKLYARAKPDRRERRKGRTPDVVRAEYRERWEGWANELPDEFTNQVAQEAWGLTYDATAGRIKRLVDEGLAEHVRWGNYKRLK